MSSPCSFSLIIFSQVLAQNKVQFITGSRHCSGPDITLPVNTLQMYSSYRLHFQFSSLLFMHFLYKLYKCNRINKLYSVHVHDDEYNFKSRIMIIINFACNLFSFEFVYPFKLLLTPCTTWHKLKQHHN